MPELSLPACPICFAKGSLLRQTMKKAEQEFLWFECGECGSMLVWMGGNQWFYQKVGREDKVHLLKQPMVEADLQDVLFRTEVELALNALQQPPQATAEQPAQEDTPSADTRSAHTAPRRSRQLQRYVVTVAGMWLCLHLPRLAKYHQRCGPTEDGSRWLRSPFSLPLRS